MNVCLLNDSFPPIVDGVANAVINYADIIEKKYGRATVATPKYPGADDSAFSFPVLRYASLNTTKMTGYRAGVPFGSSVVKALESTVPDIIHSHCPIASNVLGRILRYNMGVPLVFTYHTKFDIDIANITDARALQDAAIKFICENIQVCDEVWVVSGGAGENLRKLGYQGDYVIMENGVDFPRGAMPDDAVRTLRAELQIPDGLPVFLFVGRLMWYKGIRLIIDGLFKAKAQGADFRMVFVGGGADGQEIANYATDTGLTDKCIFPGVVRDPDLLRTYFSMADLFLFPSTFDTNGIVVREAAACSLPSVLIQGSSAAEGVTDGRTGILIDETADAMASVIMRACQDTEGIEEIGRHAMEEIYISWEDSVGRAVERYGTVIENYRSKARKRPLLAEPLFTGAQLQGELEKIRMAYNIINKKRKRLNGQISNRIDRYL